jgi:hypothetical protein
VRHYSKIKTHTIYNMYIADIIDVIKAMCHVDPDMFQEIVDAIRRIVIIVDESEVNGADGVMELFV